MAYRYKHNNQAIAEGERSVFFKDGKAYVRTGLKASTDTEITYTLREVYDDTAAGDPPAEEDPPADDPPEEQPPGEEPTGGDRFAFDPTDLEFILMADGPIDAVQNRLIPHPWPGGTAKAPRMYDVIVDGGPFSDEVIPFDGATEENVQLVVGPYTVTIGFWGFVENNYDDSDGAQMPADGVTTVPFVIKGFRVSNPAGTIVSRMITKAGGLPIELKVTGKTPAADTTPPVVSSIIPTGIDVPKDAPITINANENVVAGSGNFYLRDTDTLTTHEIIDAVNAVYAGSQITLTPVVAQGDLQNLSIRWDGGAFEDQAGNPVAAQTDDTWSWRTVPATPSNPTNAGLQPPPPDVVVSSPADVRNQLVAWAASHPGGIRCIGVDTTTTGHMNLSGIDLPERVYIRPVGGFLAGGGDPEVTVKHIGTGSLNGSRNIVLWRMDLRAPDMQDYFSGLWTADNSIDSGFYKCVGRGWPFNVAVGSTASGVTNYLFTADNTQGLIVEGNVHLYMKDGLCKLGGTIDRPRIKRMMGNYVGGDDITIANGGNMIDPDFGCNFPARDRAMSPGNHNDFIQFNQGSMATRFVSRYDVVMRGAWTGFVNINPDESGLGAIWSRGTNGTVSIGPHRHEQSLFMNGHDRAITGFTGGNSEAHFNTLVQHLNATPPKKAYPAITGIAVSVGNYCNAHFAGYNTNPGTGGKLVVLGGNVRGNGANYNLLLPDFTNIPTNYTDLWDIRPPITSELHPDYAVPGDRVGCYELWDMLFNGDPEVVLTKHAWPLGVIYKRDFDRGLNFWGGYSGIFDGDGNNA